MSARGGSVETSSPIGSVVRGLSSAPDPRGLPRQNEGVGGRPPWRSGSRRRQTRHSEGAALRPSSAREVARAIDFANPQTTDGAILDQTAGWTGATHQPPSTSRRQAAATRVATGRGLARAAADLTRRAPAAGVTAARSTPVVPRAVVAGLLLVLPVLPSLGALAVLVAPVLDTLHGMGRLGRRPVFQETHRSRQRERRHQARQKPTAGPGGRERAGQPVEDGWIHAGLLSAGWSGRSRQEQPYRTPRAVASFCHDLRLCS